jgi:hypothetical protein
MHCAAGDGTVADIVRLHFLCRYRVSAFYLSSAVSDLPMDCALPALFVVIIYFMGGLRLTATAFLSNLTALVSSAGSSSDCWLA